MSASLTISPEEVKSSQFYLDLFFRKYLNIQFLDSELFVLEHYEWIRYLGFNTACDFFHTLWDANPDIQDNTPSYRALNTILNKLAKSGVPKEYSPGMLLIFLKIVKKVKFD